METKHQSIRDYVAARKRGDQATAERIGREVVARFDTDTTDDSEIKDLYDASLLYPLGEGA